MMLADKSAQRRLHDWEGYDKIALEIVPRFKDSHYSGSEWRTGVAIKFWFKGKMIREEFRTSMRAALMSIQLMYYDENGIPGEVLDLEKVKCFQPGCSEDAKHIRFLKKLTSSRGEVLDESEKHFEYYRKFCDRHLKRGDGSIEDSDDNYHKKEVKK